jgi:hypothetical protein
VTGHAVFHADWFRLASTLASPTFGSAAVHANKKELSLEPKRISRLFVSGGLQLPGGENASAAFDAAGEAGASGLGLMNTTEFANSPL